MPQRAIARRAVLARLAAGVERITLAGRATHFAHALLPAVTVTVVGAVRIAVTGDAGGEVGAFMIGGAGASRFALGQTGSRGAALVVQAAFHQAVRIAAAPDTVIVFKRGVAGRVAEGVRRGHFDQFLRNTHPIEAARIAKATAIETGASRRARVTGDTQSAGAQRAGHAAAIGQTGVTHKATALDTDHIVAAGQAVDASAGAALAVEGAWSAIYGLAEPVDACVCSAGAGASIQAGTTRITRRAGWGDAAASGACHGLASRVQTAAVIGGAGAPFGACVTSDRYTGIIRVTFQVGGASTAITGASGGACRTATADAERAALQPGRARAVVTSAPHIASGAADDLAQSSGASTARRARTIGIADAIGSAWCAVQRNADVIDTCSPGNTVTGRTRTAGIPVRTGRHALSAVAHQARVAHAVDARAICTARRTTRIDASIALTHSAAVARPVVAYAVQIAGRAVQRHAFAALTEQAGVARIERRAVAPLGTQRTIDHRTDAVDAGHGAPVGARATRLTRKAQAALVTQIAIGRAADATGTEQAGIAGIVSGARAVCAAGDAGIGFRFNLGIVDGRRRIDGIVSPIIAAPQAGEYE